MDKKKSRKKASKKRSTRLIPNNPAQYPMVYPYYFNTVPIHGIQPGSYNYSLANHPMFQPQPSAPPYPIPTQYPNPTATFIHPCIGWQAPSPVPAVPVNVPPPVYPPQIAPVLLASLLQPSTITGIEQYGLPDAFKNKPAYAIKGKSGHGDDFTDSSTSCSSNDEDNVSDEFESSSDDRGGPTSTRTRLVQSSSDLLVDELIFRSLINTLVFNNTLIEEHNMADTAHQVNMTPSLGEADIKASKVVSRLPPAPSTVPCTTSARDTNNTLIHADSIEGLVEDTELMDTLSDRFINEAILKIMVKTLLKQ